MAVTQKQIAEALGLSRSVVGEALSGHPRIAAQTRERVLNMARELGYDAEANAEARSLIARRYGQRVKTQVLGLLLDYADTATHEVGIRTFQGIHQAVRRHDYDVLVLRRDRMAGKPGHVLAHDTRVDGFIFVNSYELRETLDSLAYLGIPAVTCMSDDNPEGIPSVMADNVAGMRAAVDHLVKLGHRRIAHLGGPMDHCDAHRRREGFTLAMRAYGLNGEAENIFNDHWGATHPTENMYRAIQAGFTAYVCSNDLQALRLWRLLEASGKRVPQDVSIVGVDDFGPAAEHGLTTLANPLTDLGRAAVDAWMDLQTGHGATSLSRLAPMELIVRRSVAPPPVSF